jgi:hypothetical protein
MDGFLRAARHGTTSVDEARLDREGRGMANCATVPVAVGEVRHHHDLTTGRSTQRMSN